MRANFKGIVSREFELCFLIPFNSSDTASPDETSLFKKKVYFVSIFDFSGLGGSSFCSEQISAQGAAAANFVSLAREQQRKVMQI
jgi:hypothetical protein